ncbi:MAG: ACP phosphodiesterase [Planctomycetota bacterium]
MGEPRDRELNYLAHGHLHLDRPWFVAGTALPDWLSASDRPSRLQREMVPEDRDLGAGVHRHMADDEWFHRTEAFQRSEVELTELVRSAQNGEQRQRSWFFGHVLVELLLDAWLMERTPSLLDDYYSALGEVDMEELLAESTPWMSQPPERLARFIGIFMEHRFLEGYRTDAGMLARLNGIARRVGLPELVPGTLEVLPRAREIVYHRAPDLLTP